MRLQLVAAALILAPSLALAAPDPAPAPATESAAPAQASLAPAFRGTITSTYPDGRQGHLWLNADGSYKAAGRRGDLSSGHWTVKGDKVCLRQSRPIPMFFAFCTPRPTSSAWNAKAATGEPITVVLSPGGRPG
jgi:hypothetical protein